jgi:hypothetical protein
LFFDGVAKPVDGVLKPDVLRPGLGLMLKEVDIKQYEV